MALLNSVTKSRNFKNEVYFVQGSTTQKKTLLTARVEYAKSVILVGSNRRDNLETNPLNEDRYVLLTSLLLHDMLLRHKWKQKSASSTTVTICSELKAETNIILYPKPLTTYSNVILN